MDIKWIKCSEQLPKIEPRRRGNKNGILVMYSDGNILHIQEVTPGVYNSMKNGVRTPLKFEHTPPPHIVLWMPLPAKLDQAIVDPSNMSKS